MSQLDQIAPGGVVNLDKAPAGLDDATFDSLFPADGASQVVQPVQQVQKTAQPDNQQTQQTQQTQVDSSQTNQPQGDFLKGDRSVYKTAEDATRGINEKDALIEQLRQRYALTTGIDPITGKPVAATNQTQQQNEPDYFNNPAQYLDDLYNAAKKGGPEAYRDVQAKFIFDAVKPLQPILQKAARDQAVATVTTEIAGMDKFVGTPAYTRALDANPELKQAITVGEQDYRFHSRLPGLYKLAYLTAQGMQLPELLKANASQTQTTQSTQQQQTQPVRQATQQVRTTVQPTTSNQPQRTANPSFRSIEGIKATIAAAEAAGATLDF